VIVILSACDACTTLSQSVLHQGMRGSIGHRLFTVWSSHRCFKNSLSRLDCKSSRVIDRAASRRRRGRSPVLPGSPAIDAPARWIHVVSALPAAWPRQRSTLAAARRVDPVDIGKQAGMCVDGWARSYAVIHSRAGPVILGPQQCPVQGSAIGEEEPEGSRTPSIRPRCWVRCQYRQIPT
jgi:hypothetical protein